MRSSQLNSQFGKFAPDSMLITLYPRYPLIGVGGTRGSLNLRGVSYLFHEWMHYLHNVSTIHGAVCFVALVEYWNIFRFTIGSRTESFGSGELPDVYQAQVERVHQVLTSARGAAGRTLPSTARLKNCRVVHVKPGNVGTDGIEEPASILIEVRRQRSRVARQIKTYDLGFSATDLLESVAYMLEAEFLRRLHRLTPFRPAVDPYQTLFLIARHSAPRLTKREILACGLASLQSTEPVNQVLKFLTECNAWKAQGLPALDLLADAVKEHLADNHVGIEDALSQTEKKFPIDAPIARALHEVLNYLRANLDHRRSDPFFELNIIEQLRAGGPGAFDATMSRLMLRHGMCSIEQVHRGPDDQVGRDFHADFTVMARDAITSEGRRVMFASFEFAKAHLYGGGVIEPTRAIAATKCPFYTSCTATQRTTQADICRRTPWDSLNWPLGIGCRYQEGAHQTRLLGRPSAASLGNSHPS